MNTCLSTSKVKLNQFYYLKQLFMSLLSYNTNALFACNFLFAIHFEVKTLDTNLSRVYFLSRRICCFNNILLMTDLQILWYLPLSLIVHVTLSWESLESLKNSWFLKVLLCKLSNHGEDFTVVDSRLLSVLHEWYFVNPLYLEEEYLYSVVCLWSELYPKYPDISLS